MTSTTAPTTTVAPTGSAPTTTVAPNAAAVEAPESVDLLRSQIDALDEAITRLVAERAQLSARVQRARMNAGGTRVELGRERVIMDTYRAALGAHGPSLADSILQVCRGTR